MRGQRPKQYPPLQVALVSVLYGEGRSQSEIADLLGITQKVVWNLMRRHGIPTRTAAKRDQRGPANHMWRGDAANYQALHLRVASQRGQPQRCEQCGTTDPTKAYDWANMTGHYSDPMDYTRLCRSCHWKHDQTHLNLGTYAQRKEVPNV